LGVLGHRFATKPKAVECDNEITQSMLLTEKLSKKFIAIEPCAPNSQPQNGAAERSGGVVVAKATAMNMTANFPSFLWRWILQAAIYLLNRTPRRRLDWVSPYEKLHTWTAVKSGISSIVRKPVIQHLKAYGCKAYAKTNTAQLKKEYAFIQSAIGVFLRFLV